MAKDVVGGVLGARHSGGDRPLPPVRICQPYIVVKLTRRCLQYISVLNRLDGMDESRRVPPGMTFRNHGLAQMLSRGALHKQQLSGQEVTALVLFFVVLQRKPVASIDVKELACVLLGVCPLDFVAPRLLDPAR